MSKSKYRYQNHVAFIDKAKTEEVRARAYISCGLDCTYEGQIMIGVVAPLYKILESNSVSGISLRDTISFSYPEQVYELLRTLNQEANWEKVA